MRRGLRILAQGGSLPNGTPFSGTLSTYIEPFTAEGFGVDITAVSTLLDRLRSAGSLTLDAAANRTTSYLQLKPGRSLYGGYVTTNDFNSTVFLKAVADSGVGFDAFIDRLVGEALSDDQRQRVFSGGLQLSPLGSMVGMELVTGAISKVGGTATGSVLSGVGIGKGDHAEVMAKLGLIEGKLDEVKGAVYEALARIANVQTEMKQQNLETQINRVMTLVVDLQAIGRFSGGERVERQQRIENTILGLEADRQLIARVLDGKLGREALIQAYADSLKVGQRFYSARHYQRLIDFIEFFDLAIIQLYYLLIEAYRSKEARGGQSYQTTVEVLAEELEAGRNSYLRRIPWALPDETTFIHTADLRMWHGSRSYYVLKDQRPALPAAVSAKGGWRIPDEATASRTFGQTDRKKIDGNRFAHEQGAPLKLFGDGGMTLWTTSCWDVPITRQAFCQVYLFADDNPMRVMVKSGTPTTNRAHYMVWRPMERAELIRYLPWLYPERRF